MDLGFNNYASYLFEDWVQLVILSYFSGTQNETFSTVDVASD
jgi:hypothetical protein